MISLGWEGGVRAHSSLVSGVTPSSGSHSGAGSGLSAPSDPYRRVCAAQTVF